MIYGAVGSARLGDCWMGINKAIYDSKQKGIPVKFSTWNPKKRINIRTLLEDILSLLDFEADIELVDTIPSPEFSEVYKKKGWRFYPTKTRWVYGPWCQICYQYDGISGGHNKNPPAVDLEFLTNFISGITFRRLGRHMSLHENIKVMAQSDCFVGIDSGFSHISHSVGIPRFFIEYKYDFSGRHKGRDYVLCKGTADAIIKVTEFMGNIRASPNDIQGQR